MGKHFLLFILISKEWYFEFDRCYSFSYMKKVGSELGWVFGDAVL